MIDRLDKQDKRLDKQDETMERLSNILSEQKHLAHTVDTLILNTNENSKRLTLLEQKDAKIALSAWLKFANIFIGAAFAAVAAYIINLIQKVSMVVK